MSNRSDGNTLLAAHECAERIGLTARALRLYEKRGLIKPRRTEKGWRLYGADEIARLHEVLALKQLGLSLARITALLQGKAVDLDRILTLQQAALREQHSRAERGLSLVGAARAKLSTGGSLSTDELIKLAKEATMSETQTDEVAWRRYEQARPRSAIAIDPALLDFYIGDYRLTSGLILSISRRGESLLLETRGQTPVELFAESVAKFFLKFPAAQVSFVPGPGGRADALILHQDGHESMAERISADEARRIAEALGHRVQSNLPHPDSEAALRRVIAEYQAGHRYVENMSPELAVAVQEQFSLVSAALLAKGALEALRFNGLGQSGVDLYEAHFAAPGALECGIGWTDDGVIHTLWLRPVP